MKYKYIGTEERIFPSLGLDLKPGDEFEDSREIASPLIDKIEEVPENTQTFKEVEVPTENEGAENQ